MDENFIKYLSINNTCARLLQGIAYLKKCIERKRQVNYAIGSGMYSDILNIYYALEAGVTTDSGKSYISGSILFSSDHSINLIEKAFQLSGLSKTDLNKMGAHIANRYQNNILSDLDCGSYISILKFWTLLYFEFAKELKRFNVTNLNGYLNENKLLEVAPAEPSIAPQVVNKPRVVV